MSVTRIRFTTTSSIQKIANGSAYIAELCDYEKTAAIMIDSDDLESKSISELSRLFPYSEAGKMVWFEHTAQYPDFNAAFEAGFQTVSSMRVNP